MGILKSIIDITAMPIRCVGELGKDLSSLTDDRKDESDGFLAIGTLGLASITKGIVKSLEKAGEDLDD